MLTVVFATYNGADTLPLMLPSLTRLEAPEGGWKLIAVDNGSTDETCHIIQNYQNFLPLTILNESRRGKNHALNAAIPYIEGDAVIFTDDDVIVPPYWLTSFRRLSSDKPDYDVFGGAIRPYWTRKPDNWIINSVSLGGAFALTNPERPEGPVGGGAIWGPNMALRSSIFDQGHRFSVDIGPDGTSNYVMGSETELTIRLADQGYKCWFAPEIAVHHIILPHQLSKEWLRRRAFRCGRGLYVRNMTQQNNSEKPVKLLGVPRWIIRQYIQQKLLNSWRGILQQHDRKTEGLWNEYCLLGQISQARALNRERKA